jgi:hypothetical protein
VISPNAILPRLKKEKSSKYLNMEVLNVKVNLKSLNNADLVPDLVSGTNGLPGPRVQKSAAHLSVETELSSPQLKEKEKTVLDRHQKPNNVPNHVQYHVNGHHGQLGPSVHPNAHQQPSQEPDLSFRKLFTMLQSVKT